MAPAFFYQRVLHLRPADGGVEWLDVGQRANGSERVGENLGGLLTQLQLPARNLGWEPIDSGLPARPSGWRSAEAASTNSALNSAV